MLLRNIIMPVYHKIKTIYLTLILSLFGSFCLAQNTVSIPVNVRITHSDSISINASTLPEFKNSVSWIGIGCEKEEKPLVKLNTRILTFTSDKT